MKKLFILLSAVFLVTVSCDKIEPFEDGTYKTVPEIEIGGDTIPHVILFEFTGWNCPNCPSGHDMIHDLEEIYHESVKAIAIHAGFFAEPGNDNYYDFRCDVGDDLHKQFDNTNIFPSASVNNMNSSSLSASVEQWAIDFNTAYELANNEPEAFIMFDYSNNGTVLEADVKIEFANTLQGDFNLSVYVVENGIEDIQNNLGIIEDYVHSHVLRASMSNGIIGDLVETNPSAGTIFEKSFSLNIDSEWVADSLHVIPFIYNTETNIVIPTKIIKLKTN